LLVSPENTVLLLPKSCFRVHAKWQHISYQGARRDTLDPEFRILSANYGHKFLHPEFTIADDNSA
jgi:hypothetical protein